MAYFALEITEVRKRVFFIESSDEDQAYTDWEQEQGEEVWDRVLEKDFSDIKEITQEEFAAKKIPEKFK